MANDDGGDEMKGGGEGGGEKGGEKQLRWWPLDGRNLFQSLAIDDDNDKDNDKDDEGDDDSHSTAKIFSRGTTSINDDNDSNDDNDGDGGRRRRGEATQLRTASRFLKPKLLSSAFEAFDRDF